jgi:Domain of unknown function (DUF4956)
MSLQAAPAKANDSAAKPPAVFKLFRPYCYITGYYVALAAALMLAIYLNPALVDVLPMGGGVGGEANSFEPVNGPAPDAAAVLAASIKLALSIIASFLLMLPVTWICMGARRRKDVTQSFVQTILVLPLVITGIVHVVHDSLALAFSLAGIVAGVRFRHTLKDSAETTYLFTAIAVGVACGVNAVEVAAIISIFFNYAVLGLWAVEYGGQGSGKQMFSREWMAKKEPKRDGERESDRDDDDD